jgi:type I restriction enzyme S subunit
MTPDHWPKHPLSEVCDLVNGNGFKASEWVTSGLPIIRIQNLNGSREFNYYDGEVQQKWLVEPGDLLFAWAGVKGVSFGPRIWNGPRGVLNQHIFRVVPKNGVTKEYLHAVMGLVTSRIEAKSHGFKANFVHVQRGDVLDQTVAVPVLRIQKEITDILSTWDRAIELTAKLIVAMQKRKAALMQQLLTGKVRFKQFVHSLERHRTVMGEMPVDWKSRTLGSITAKVKRKNVAGESHVLTASGEHGLVDQREFFNRSVAGADLSGYYLLKRGEFAYNRSAMNGYPFGAIKRLDRYEQGVLSTLYVCFGLSGDGTCDSDFMEHYFEARLLDRQLGEVTQVGGRAHGLLNITDADFYSMQVVLPGIEEQRKIAPVLNEQQREVELLRQKLDALRRQKKGLMQQLLTGKVRVKVTESSGV